MSYNPMQDKVDKLIKQETEKVEEEKQPYERESIRRFILETIAMLREQGKTEAQIEGIVKNQETVFNMTQSEFKSYCERIDTENLRYVEEYNQEVIFREIVKMEIKSKGLSGIQARQFEKARIEAYKAGKFNYNNEALLKTIEILLTQADAQKPPSLKTLKSKGNIQLSEIRLIEIEDSRNQLVGNPSNQALKFKR